MTQRVELAAVIDRMAIDDVVTEYATTVADAAPSAYGALFAARGTTTATDRVADEQTTTRLAETLAQLLIVNRRVHIDTVDGALGDTARVLADYFGPLRDARHLLGGRCTFDLARTHEGWRLRHVSFEETWRQT